MKKWALRTIYTILAILVVAGLVYHLGLRHWCMRWGTTNAEVHATLPGDDLFPVYSSEVTHAITIHASPEKVCAELVQAGIGVRGFAVTSPSLEDLFVGLTGEGFDVSG